MKKKENQEGGKPKVLLFNPIMLGVTLPLTVAAFVLVYSWTYQNNSRIADLTYELSKLEGKQIATAEEVETIRSLHDVKLALRRIEIQIESKANDFDTRIRNLERVQNEQINKIKRGYEFIYNKTDD